jgi:hypothetical protein
MNCNLIVDYLIGDLKEERKRWLDSQYHPGSISIPRIIRSDKDEVAVIAMIDVLIKVKPSLVKACEQVYREKA